MDILPKHLILLSLIFHSSITNLVNSKCPKSFQCGNLTLEFPFSNNEDPACGLVTVDDCDSHYPKILSEHGKFSCTLLNAIQPNKLIILDPWLQNQTKSCDYLLNISLRHSPSISFTFSPNITIFSCLNQSYEEPIDDHFRNYNSIRCGISTVYYKTPAAGVPSAEEILRADHLRCLMSQLPVKSNQDEAELFHLLAPEFSVEWSVSEDCNKCHRRGGQCLSNSRNEFECKDLGAGSSSKVKLILGNRMIEKIVLIGGVTFAALIIIFIWRKYTPLRLFAFQKAKQGYEKDIELFLKNNGNLAPIRYKFSEIKKVTKSFSENLGKGGYGSVYKGKLPDGRPVAVKILNESKGNGEEFMNEVASISRTSHINIVTLLGFCYEGGSKRALIYEFMPNGSLEKFIHNTASSSAQGVLGWEKLIHIALGIARGLEYLHQGCNTRILHFDIKPHNILLDKDLNPRISDFGLAKLCPNRSSIVSMLVARGTIGYIAPEVFCRNFGEVSHKSDVYSYGMMVLEIAGGKKNNDPMDMDRTSEIYFPQYIYKQLEMDDERSGNLCGIMNEGDNKFVKRKLIIVGLWCIQTDPMDRPSMSKVVEMLEGDVESLQLPPKPYFSSPPRPALQFSISESV